MCNYLEKLDRRVLYYDTDSIILTTKEEDWVPPVGDFLGDLTGELAEYGAGSHIQEFVSGGPKNYTYEFFKAKDQTYETRCKVKGRSLNYKNQQSINFENIKNLLFHEYRGAILFLYRKICGTYKFSVAFIGCQSNWYFVSHPNRSDKRFDRSNVAINKGAVARCISELLLISLVFVV